MAVILISSTFNIRNSSIGRFINKNLKEYHSIYNSDTGSRRRFVPQIITEYAELSDMYIIIISPDYTRSSFMMHEFRFLMGLAEKSEHKLFLPIIIGEYDSPPELVEKFYLRSKSYDFIDGSDDIIDQINMLISSSHEKSLTLYNEEQKQIDEDRRQRLHIEKNASEYVDDAITQLKEREIDFFKKARHWYRLGYSTLGVGVAATIFFSYVSLLSFPSEKILLSVIAFSTFKNMIIVGVLLVMTRYSISIAKSYMNESLKSSDRIHAISFGKFYLQTYGKTAERDDIKDVFQHWNINGQNSFSAQTDDVINPKIIEMTFDLAKSVVERQCKKK